MNNRSPAEFILTHDYAHRIEAYLNWLAVCYLTETSKALFSKYAPFLEKQQLNYLSYHITQKPTPEKVARVLECKPALLNYEFTKISLNKRTSKGNPLQLAFREEDEAMSKTIIFYHMTNQNEKGLETCQQFQQAMKSNKYIYFDFKPILNAIFAEQFNHGQDSDNKYVLDQTTLDAIDFFRKTFDQAQTEKIYEEIPLFWTTSLYTAYMMAYTNYLETMTNPMSEYSWVLFFEVVIAKLLEYLPVNILQQVCHLTFDNETPPHLISKSKHDFYDFLQKPSNTFELNSSCINFSSFPVRKKGFSGVLNEQTQLENFYKKKTHNFATLFKDTASHKRILNVPEGDQANNNKVSRFG